MTEINKHNQAQEKTTRHLFKLKENHKYTFYVDLETTGTDPIRNDVIEICCLVTEKNKFEIIDKFHSYVKPRSFNSYVWTKAAQDVHGISIEKAESFPSLKEVGREFLIFCDKYRDKKDHCPQLFVCHANRHSFYDKKTGESSWGMFDYNFLEWFFRKIGDRWYYAFLKVFSQDYCLSTVWLAKELGFGNEHLIIDGIPQYTKTGRPKKEGNGLAVWAKRIGFHLKHHDAQSDTECCLRVHEFLQGEISD